MGEKYNFLAFLKEDFQALTKSEFRMAKFLSYLLRHLGFQAVFIFRLSSFCRKKKLKIISFFLDKTLFFLYGCEIRSTARIGGGFTIAHPAGIVIGGKVNIGKNFSIRQGVTVGGNMGKSKLDGLGHKYTQPIVGNNVTVGCHGVLLGPINVSDRTIVGAGSVLLEDTLVGDVMVGAPARRIKGK